MKRKGHPNWVALLIETGKNGFYQLRTMGY